MHDLGIIHGDLKGVRVCIPSYHLRLLTRSKANITVHDDGRALLTDFALITLIPDQSTFPSIDLEGGTLQWMSPELIDPKRIDLEHSLHTKESDCYALGMVIYEVLSGCAPYSTDNPFIVLRKVLNGERPERPRGEAGEVFTDGIWDVMQLCWRSEPSERANAKDVLPCLEGNPSNV